MQQSSQTVMDRRLGGSALALCFAVSMGCGTDVAPTADAAASGAGSRDAAASDAAMSDAAMSDAAMSDATVEAGSGEMCPPCVPPPNEACVGSGPCGCGPYVCPGDESSCEAFDQPNRSCQTADDCDVVVHQVNCCGTTRAMGINKAVAAYLGELEKLCRETYPACGCPTGPQEADDGTTANGANDANVTCAAGVCATSFKP